MSSSSFYRAILVAALGVTVLMVGSASASAATYYLQKPPSTAPSTHCYAGYGYVDLSEVFPAAPSATFTGQARFACTQPFPAGAR